MRLPQEIEHSTMYQTINRYTHYTDAFEMFWSDNPDCLGEDSECAFVAFVVWCKQTGTGIRLDDGSIVDL